MKYTLLILTMLVSTYSLAQDYKLKYVFKSDYHITQYELKISEKFTIWEEVAIVDQINSNPTKVPGTNKKIDGNHAFVYQKASKRNYTFKYVYGDHKTNTFLSNAKPYSGRKYIKEPIKKIEWTIQDSTQKVLDIDCQIATCSYKGRDYTAYFSTKIPLPYGPWKLHGLPGIIIKAVTEQQSDGFKDRMILECVKIERVTPSISNKDLKKYKKFQEHKFYSLQKVIDNEEKYMKYFVEQFKKAEAEEYPDEYEGKLTTRKLLFTLEIFHKKLQSSGIEIWAD